MLQLVMVSYTSSYLAVPSLHYDLHAWLEYISSTLTDGRAGAHVNELDVVHVAVGDGLVHLLILGYPVPEVLQRLHPQQLFQSKHTMLSA